MDFIRFKHSRFSARFPASYRYSKSHYWMAQVEDDAGVWRVGFTKFATRMLGELVDAEFSVQLGEEIQPGQEIGWVEGFKATSDVFSVMTGAFSGKNPILDVDACIVRSDPYRDGWLYAVRGEPESESLDATCYVELLQQTIGRMEAKEDSNSKS